MKLLSMLEVNWKTYPEEPNSKNVNRLLIQENTLGVLALLYFAGSTSRPSSLQVFRHPSKDLTERELPVKIKISKHQYTKN